LNGSGHDIWDTADGFRYVYQPLSGDGTIIARVVSQTNTSQNAKAGVMIRETLDPGSTHATLVLVPRGVPIGQFLWRTATEGYTSNTDEPAVSPPYWVKLVRSGNTFTGSVSPDGVTYTQVDSEIVPMASNVYVGLVDSSQNDYQLSTDTFDNVSITTSTSTPTSTATATSTATPTPTAVINNAGFETPNLAAGTYQYDPTNAGWTFSSESGIASNGSAFTLNNPNAPEGTQVGFLRLTGTTSQDVALAGGSYTVSFRAAQRGNYQVAQQDFQVQIDGTVVGTFTPSDTSYSPYTTNSFTVAAGTHTLAFVGLDTAGGDNTAFIDAVSIDQSPATPTPVVTQTATATPTSGVTPTPTPLAPDVSVSLINPGGSTYSIGSQLVYNATVCNGTVGGAVTSSNSIAVSGVLPLGLTNISITGTGWSVNSLTSTTGPALYTVTYTGTYPLPVGLCLPPLVITGTITSAAVPGISTAISLNVPGDTNTSNNAAVSSVIVSASTPTPGLTPTATPTPTPGVTPTATPTLTPLSPDLSVQLTNQGGNNTYTAGDPVVYNATVCNVPTAAAVTTPNAITLTGVIQLGLTGVTVNGTGWTITSLSATTSPLRYTATYTGSYPVSVGGCLPPLVINGTTTPEGAEGITSFAQVSLPGEANLENNTALNSISVHIPAPGATPTTTATPETTPTPTTTSTSTPTLLAPDVLVSLTTNQERLSYRAGDPIVYNATVCSGESAADITTSNSITVSGILPLGLAGIAITGNGWTVTALSSTTGPASYTATYTGKYPVQAGTCLSPLLIRGTLTPDSASGEFASTATASITGSGYPSSDMAVNVIIVRPSHGRR
jgi:hypothetical protein